MNWISFDDQLPPFKHRVALWVPSILSCDKFFIGKLERVYKSQYESYEEITSFDFEVESYEGIGAPTHWAELEGPEED